MSGWGIKTGLAAKGSGASISGGTDGRPEFPGRRSFITVLLGVGTALVGGLLSIPLIRFAFFPILRRTTNTEWSDAGEAAKFASITAPAEPVITVKQADGWRTVISRKPVFVLPPHAGPHRVVSAVCPHLGCSVQWKNSEKHFFCPCHGSEFAPDGSLLKGPAPRGLDYLDSKMEDGQLLVRYQYFELSVPYREVIG